MIFCWALVNTYLVAAGPRAAAAVVRVMEGAQLAREGPCGADMGCAREEGLSTALQASEGTKD